MANKESDKVSIDGDYFKNWVIVEYGSIDEFAKAFDRTSRTIYNYIKNNMLPKTLYDKSGYGLDVEFAEESALAEKVETYKGCASYIDDILKMIIDHRKEELKALQELKARLL